MDAMVEIKKGIAEPFARLAMAREAIVDATLGAHGVFGGIACPVCKTGVLSYSVDKGGVIHAGCSSRGCVRWME